jgi:6-phosphogluconolactonase
VTDAVQAGVLPGRVTVQADPDSVANAAGERIAELSHRAVRDHGAFTIALAGGDTPRLLYQQLAREPLAAQIDWGAWRVYFSDERAVAPTHNESNFRMAKETLLDHVRIPERNVHRMPAERRKLDAAADEYSRLLAGSLRRANDGAPRCDCILLGLGENGHTASLFPGTPALDVVDRWATRGRADYEPFDRMTFTFPMINAAEYVVFLVTGGAKMQALAGVAAGSVPASRVRPVEGSLLWFLDRAVAEGVPGLT